MKINTFQDIENIDIELAGLFLRTDEAVNWIATVNNDIKEWIAKHNKQHWEVVRYVSKERGILGRLKSGKRNYKLTRKDFANILIKFCPEALEERDTVSSLITNMDHYTWENAYGRGPSGTSLARTRDVEELLDHHQLEQPEVSNETPTLEDLMYDHLKNTISNEDKYPRSVLRVKEQYEKARPALSVETYYSKTLLDKKQYTHVVAFEFVEEVLTLDKLYGFIVKYSKISKMKLFVVSKHSLIPTVEKEAADNNVGYIFIDPSRYPIEPEYKLPRSVEDYVKKRHDFEILIGKHPMNSPVLIMDGDNITSSLTDILMLNEVEVKSRIILEIPFLKEEEVEVEADKLSAEYVQYCLINKSLWNSGMELSVNPFAIADKLGLAHDVENLEDDNQLGRLDVLQRRVTLNSSGMNNYSRYRFTMAHELGHYLLHVPWFNRCGIVSVGETEYTLNSTITFDKRRMEYQANLFASYLLMPKVLVAHLYNYFYDKYVHQLYGDELKKIYYSHNQPETWPQYNNVVVRMAKLLEVSREALNIRLISLNLLEMH